MDVILIFYVGLFFAILPPQQLKKSKLKKKTKTPGDIIILHNCTKKSWSCAILFLIYSAWKMWFLFFILCYFLPFYPSSSPKIQKFLKKWKKCWEISSFYICVQKIMIRWCLILEIWCPTDKWTDGQTDRQTEKVKS